MQEPKRIPVSDDEDAVVYSKPMQQKMAAMNRAADLDEQIAAFRELCGVCKSDGGHYLVRTRIFKTKDQAAEAWNARWERTCAFTLEPDREELAKREGMTAGEFATCDIPLGWTCGACGAQYRPLVGFPPKWMVHAPCCGARVVSES